jgi:hypothetical protein
MGMDGTHARAFTGRRQPLFSAGCDILAGSAGNASTAARRGRLVGI